MKALDWFIVYLSFKLLGRPRFPLKRRGEGFALGLCRNVEKLKLGAETELRLQACAIAASSRSRKQRKRICEKAFVILDSLRSSIVLPTSVVNLRHEECDVRIDRTSKWGNPYRIGPDGDRDEVCDKYEVYLLGRVDLLRALEELRGKRLGCWCKPLRCHGDILVRFLGEGVPWRRVSKRRIRRK